MSTAIHRGLINRTDDIRETRRDKSLWREIEDEAATRGLQNFCTNDYLGLAVETVSDAASPTGATASRIVVGTTSRHRMSERRFARFVGHEDSRLFSSGYAANLGLLSTLPLEDDVVFSDELNHASIIDGLKLGKAKKSIYRHCDLSSLREQLHVTPCHGLRWIVTESIFSMDGDGPDLRTLRALADEYDAILVVDEAHSLGLVGPEGKGALAQCGINADIIVAPLGKSFGLWGAMIASSEKVMDLLEQSARSYVYTTATSPILSELLLSRLDKVRKASKQRALVLEHASTIQQTLFDLGLARETTVQGAIVPLLLGSTERALETSSSLRERGFLVRAIRPPTVSENSSRLRIVPSAIHSSRDIERFCQALAEILTP